MAWSLNRAQIIGNATRDPELRTIPSGQSVTSFAVATNRRWKDQQGNQQEAAEFHEVVAWGKLAEIVQQIVKKGNRIYVEGRLQTRSWDAPDGSKRNRTEIVMENFVPLTPKSGGEPMTDFSAPAADKESKSKSAKKSETKEKEKPAEGVDEINLDDIPF